MFKYTLKKNPQLYHYKNYITANILRYNHLNLLNKLKIANVSDINTKGVCSGYAYMAIGYGISGKINEFKEATYQIYNTPNEEFALDDANINYEFKNFLQGISLAQSPYLYPKIFDGHYGQNDHQAIFDCLFRHQLISQPDNLKMVHLEVINGNILSITNPFKEIAKIANEAQANIFIKVSSLSHAICVQYNYIYKSFDIIDANKFPYTESVSSIEDIGIALIDAFGESIYPSYALKIFSENPCLPFPSRLVNLKNINLNTVVDPITGNNMLMSAAKYGDLAALDYLIQKINLANFSLEDKSTHGVNALFYSVSGNQLGSLKLLMDGGADPLITTQEEMVSPLHYAAARGFFSICEYLLEQPLEMLNMKDSFGETPLHYAVRAKNIHIIKLFIQHNADLNTQNNASFMSALHYAAKSGDTQTASLLVKAGAKTNLTNHKGMTPYDLAIEANNHEIAEICQETCRHVRGKRF